MQDWESEFENIRAGFLARAADRLTAINSLIEKLYCTPADDKLLRDLRQHFHWLCGVGGTYKMPQVSDLGCKGEELCDSLMGSSESPSVTDIGRLHKLIDLIRTHFQPADVA